MSEFAHRRTRLTVLGTLSMVVGGFCALLALLMLLAPMVARALPGTVSIEVDLRSILIEAFFCLSMAAAFVWLGIGSLKARRWARPLMLILAWTWLLSGVVFMLSLVFMLDQLVSVAAAGVEPMPPEARFFLKVFVVAVMTVIWLILPAVFVWGYQNKDVQRTCEASNPAPSWTDRCPLFVLGLSIGLGAGAYLALPAAAFAVVPAFGQLLTGWPAALLILLAAAVSAYLAWATFRLEPAGWWGSVVLLLVIGISSSVTLLRVDLIDIYREMGYPEHQLEIMRQYGTLNPSWTTGLVLLLTVACVGYLVYIRKYFSPEARSGSDLERYG